MTLGRCVFCGSPLKKVNETLYQCENCKRLYWLAVQYKIILCCVMPKENDNVHVGSVGSQ